MNRLAARSRHFQLKSPILAEKWAKDLGGSVGGCDFYGFRFVLGRDVWSHWPFLCVPPKNKAVESMKPTRTTAEIRRISSREVQAWELKGDEHPTSNIQHNGKKKLIRPHAPNST